MQNHQLINQSSGKTEYYTPAEIVDAARWVMDGIDLDPASSAEANKRIRAKAFFCEADNGLSRQWHGAVWLNHPFGRISNPAWIGKLVMEFQQRWIREACSITFASTSEQWFQPLLRYPQCFLCPRTNYLLPDGNVLRGVTKGSVVTYLGPNPQKFTSRFSEFGVCKVKA